MTSSRAPIPSAGHGLHRYRTLYRLWRNEREEPEPFYRLLAAEAVADLARRHGPLRDTVVADLGCGPGYYTDAFRDEGALVIAVDGDFGELLLAGTAPDDALLADAGRLPLPDASVDGVFCSNLLEHARDPSAVIAEMARVLRPGGWGYLSWTNWYSPWGGHDMTPYHYLGPRWGPRLYERRHGPPRKNRYGEALFAVHIGPTLALFDERPDLEVEVVEPRYWPWARAIMRVPGLREVASWNCVVRFTRAGVEPSGGSRPESPELRRFEHTWAELETVEGWLAPSQARRLWDRASALEAPATIVEIGSYRGRSASVLARAAAPGVEVVAIDPHAGNDRGPQQWVGTEDEGQSDHDAFWANLGRLGVADRVRHVRRFSQDAHDAVTAPIDLLYVDGAHGYRPALDDLRRWGGRVAPGGTMLVHDSFSSVGVTLALLRTMVGGRHFRYVGRSRSMAEYRRVDLSATARVANGARQLAELGWFARNLVIKAATVAHLPGVARLLGHHDGPWPY